MKLNDAVILVGRFLSNSCSKSSTFPLTFNPQIRFLCAITRFDLRFTRGGDGGAAAPRLDFGFADETAAPRFDFGFTRGYDETIAMFRKIMERWPPPPAAVFNKKLRPVAVVKMGRFALAFYLFEEMLHRDAPVNCRTLNYAVQCCCGLGRPDFGFGMLGFFIKRGDELNAHTFAPLIKGLLSAGEIQWAVHLWAKLLDEHPHPDDESCYNLTVECVYSMK